MKRILLVAGLMLAPLAANAEPGSRDAAKAKVANARANAAGGSRPQVSRPAGPPNASRPGNRPEVSRPEVNRPRPGNNGNRPGHNGNNTVIINNNQSHNWNGNRVHGGRYRYPHGYRYHRHGIGHTLPHAFLAATFYYSAYSALGLIEPPHNYVWVRYGPDLLLVHTRTGYVRDVRYGVFDG